MGKRHALMTIILCLGVTLTLAACGGGKIKFGPFGGPTDLGEGAAGTGVDAGDLQEQPLDEIPDFLGEEETQGVDGATTSAQTVCECPETTCTSGRREVSTGDRSKTLTLARTLKTYSATTGETVTDTLGNTFNSLTLDGNSVAIIQVADGTRLTQANSAGDGTNILQYSFTPEISFGVVTFEDESRLTKVENENADTATVVYTYFSPTNAAKFIVAQRNADGATITTDSGVTFLSANAMETIYESTLSDWEVVRTTDKKMVRNESGTEVQLDPELITTIKSFSAEMLVVAKAIAEKDRGATHTLQQGSTTGTTLRDDTETDRGDTGVTTDREAAGAATAAPVQETLSPGTFVVNPSVQTQTGAPGTTTRGN